MTATHWTNEYVGIPYREFGRDRAGCDCWGLACIAYAEQLGIVLPSYIGAYASVEELAELSAHIGDVTGNGVWRLVDGLARPFDLAVFRRGRYDTHVGIVVNPGLMLHTAADDQAKLEHYQTGRWHHRLNGVYRHLEMTSRAAR